MFDFFLPKEALVRCVMMMQNWELLDVPEDGEAPPCADDDAAAKDESQGMVNNCKEAGEKGLCEHATIGPLAQGLCPVTCRKCPKAGNTRRAGPIDAYYGWRGIPECNFGGSPCSIRIG